MNIEQAHRERDKRLRRGILTALSGALRFGPAGDLDGVTLRDIVVAGLPDAQQFEDDDHAIGLIRSLAAKELVEETKKDLRRGERFGLRHMRLRILARGTSLLNESIPVDPDIDDERMC